jgi:tetraacyldisaccharide 4'-kinase
VPSLLQRKPDVEVILLDDAFQHRSIQPSLNILITDANHLYTKDYILPFGRLREFKNGASRADIIIVSKCDENLSLTEKGNITKEINPLQHQHIFFSTIQYQSCYELLTNETIDIRNAHVLIVSGIANNDSLLAYIRTQTKNLHLLGYRDHHYFTKDDVEEMVEAYNNLQNTKKYLVTTQKDATRLLLHKELFVQANIKIVVLPIKISFLFHQGEQFDSLILQHLLTYYPPVIYEEVLNNQQEEYGTQES